MPPNADSERIIAIARAIAERAPAKRNGYAFAALIPWALIEDLRDALALNDSVMGGEDAT